MSESKISPYNLNDLKNTTDDALGNYLRGLKFEQDNSKLDVRLVTGYTAVIIAGVLFAADYKLGWDATKAWTLPAVVAYALLNTFFTYWLWMVEKGIVFEGTRNGKKISIASKTKKYDPTYYLTVTTTSGSSKTSKRELQTPFTTWFTADGYIVAQPLQKWLASSVETIGEADPKNASKDEKIALESSMGSVAESTGVESGKGQGSKRNKKKA